MADIAIIIKNLLKVFSGEKKLEETPKFVATVVITLARINQMIKKGKIFLLLNIIETESLNGLLVLNRPFMLLNHIESFLD